MATRVVRLRPAGAFPENRGNRPPTAVPVRGGRRSDGAGSEEQLASDGEKDGDAGDVHQGGHARAAGHRRVHAGTLAKASGSMAPTRVPHRQMLITARAMVCAERPPADRLGPQLASRPGTAPPPARRPPPPAAAGRGAGRQPGHPHGFGLGAGPGRPRPARCTSTRSASAVQAEQRPLADGRAGQRPGGRNVELHRLPLRPGAAAGVARGEPPRGTRAMPPRVSPRATPDQQFADAAPGRQSAAARSRPGPAPG